MKRKDKNVKIDDDYNCEGLEDTNDDTSKICKNNNKNNFDDIFQRIDMLHKDYQSRTFLNDFSDFDNIFKSYFCGLRKTDNKNRRN